MNDRTRLATPETAQFPVHWLLMLFAVGLILRLAVTFFISDLSKLFEYQIIARNLVTGQGISWDDWGRMPLQPTSIFPPLYIYWCALFINFFGDNYLPMYLVQALIAASGCIPAYLLGQRLFSRRTGLLFATLYTVYPELIFVHSRPVPEFAYVVWSLWILVFYLWLRDRTPGSREATRLAMGLGLIAGAGILLREGILIVTGACLIAVLWRLRPLPAVLRSHILPVIVGIMLVLVPWAIRNQVVQGKFTLIRSAYGLNLWMGNNSEATGTDKTMDGGYQMNRLWERNAEYYATAMPTRELERAAFMKQEAFDYIRAHPLHYMQLTARRLLYYFWFDPTHPLAANRIYRLSYILLLLAAIPGFVLLVRRRQLDPALAVTLLGFMALYVPIIVLPRYRIIQVVLMLLFAACFVNYLWSRWEMRAHRPDRSLLRP